MILEPHAVTSVSTPAIRMDKPATLADYLANIARRFPECVNAEGLAKPVALARREVHAMRFATGNKEHRSASTVSSPAASAVVQAQRAAWESRRAEREASILDYLTEDFRTSGDVATRFGVSIETAQQALRKLKEEGRIVTGKRQRVTIYRKAGLEIEPEPTPEPEPKGISPAPIVVDVRGEVFPSMRACARHFGVSKQSVHDAVKRGRTDMIGLRKMEAAQ